MINNLNFCSLLLHNGQVIYTHLWNTIDLNNALKKIKIMIEFITNNFFIIYIVGFILTYILCKLMRGKMSNNWNDVIATILTSLFSWISLIGLIITLLIFLIKIYLEKTKPPKWL